jgi:radical SAM protein with 4Fe4S-binding SPASM domain
LETGRRCFHCFAGIHNGIVDYKGDVNVCEVLMEDPGNARIGNLKDYDMDFRALWNSPEAHRLRRLVNRHPACRGCTHETMGYMPSLLFQPNALGWVFGPPKGTADLAAGPDAPRSRPKAPLARATA